MYNFNTAMESAAANVRKKRQTLIRKPLSDCTNTITSLNILKTGVRSRITPSKILPSTFKHPKNTIIDKKFEEKGNYYDDSRKSGSNNEPQRLTGVPSTTASYGEPGLVKNPNKRKFVSTERIGEKGNQDDEDVNRENIGSSDSDGFSSSNMHVSEQITVLHPINGDDDDDDDDDDGVVEAMTVHTNRRAANKRMGEVTMEAANRQTLNRKPLSGCTNTIRSLNSSKTITKIPIEPSIVLLSTPKDLKNTKIGTLINKSIGKKGNNNANQKCGSTKVDDPKWLTDGAEPMTVYASRRTAKKRMGEEMMVAGKRKPPIREPLSECTNTITSFNSSKIITKIPIEPPKVLLSTLEVPTTTNIDASIDKSVGEKELSNADQTCGSNEVDDSGWLTDLVEAMTREAAAKRKGKAKIFDDSFSRPPVEKVTAIRDESSNGKDVEPSKICIVPPQKKQEIVRSDKEGIIIEEKETYEAFIKEQKAYYDEVDAFELIEEEVTVSEV